MGHWMRKLSKWGLPQHEAGEVQDEHGQSIVLESKKVLSRVMGTCQRAQKTT